MVDISISRIAPGRFACRRAGPAMVPITQGLHRNIMEVMLGYIRETGIVGLKDVTPILENQMEAEMIWGVGLP